MDILDPCTFESLLFVLLEVLTLPKRYCCFRVTLIHSSACLLVHYEVYKSIRHTQDSGLLCVPRRCIVEMVEACDECDVNVFHSLWARLSNP